MVGETCTGLSLNKHAGEPKLTNSVTNQNSFKKYITTYNIIL